MHSPVVFSSLTTQPLLAGVASVLAGVASVLAGVASVLAGVASVLAGVVSVLYSEKEKIFYLKYRTYI